MKKQTKLISVIVSWLMIMSLLAPTAALAADVYYSVSFVDENGEQLGSEVSVKKGSFVNSSEIPALPKGESSDYIDDGNAKHSIYSWDSDPETTEIKANTVFTRTRTTESHDYNFAKPSFTFKPDSKNGLAAMYECSKCGAIGEIGVEFDGISTNGLKYKLDASAIGGNSASISGTLDADDLKKAVELAEKLGAPTTVTSPLKTAITVLDKVGDVVSKITEATCTCAKEGHLYSKNPSYSWSDDHSECTVTFTCTRSDCSETYDNHTVSKKMKVEGPDYTYADCLNNGIESYSASCKFTETNLGAVEDDVIDFSTEYSKVWQKALGHNYSSPKSNDDATCQHNGTSSQTCSRCGKTLTSEDAGTQLDHIAGADITVSYKAPTCTEEGERVVKNLCTMCGEEMWERRTIVLDKLGHEAAEPVVEDYVLPDCDKGGSFKRVTYCKNCGEVLDSEEVLIPARTHVPGEAVKENADSSTCTEGGSYESVVYCELCGKELSREMVPVDKASHNYVETRIEPDCNNDGKVIKTCTVCGYSYESEILDATEHKHEAHYVEPTCQNDGYTVYKCIYCDDEYVIIDEGTKTEHNWDKGEVTTQPSCEGKGEKTFTCSDCGAIRTEAIAPINHKFKSVVTEPTCTRYGYTTKVCENCGYSYIDETSEKAPKGHTEMPPVRENENEPTCTKEGYYDSVVYCKDCGEELRRTKINLKKKVHNNHKNTVPSSCEEQGYTEYTCQDCHTEYIADFLPYEDHTPVTVSEEVPPTCTTKGTTAKIVCRVCNTVLQEATEISETQHIIATDKEIPATCEAPGLTEGTYCSVCEKEFTKKEVIPAKGHTPVVDKAVAATFAKVGKTAGKHCAVCKKVLVAQKTIPKLVPSATTLSKLSSSKKQQMKITWKKQTKNTTGYEIQLATDSKFKKNKKTVTLKNSKTSTTVKKLKANKKYYVRIRTYKSYGGKKYYSAWSKSKTVKVK